MDNMEEIKQDELKKEFKKEFTITGSDTQNNHWLMWKFVDSPDEVFAWIASKINEAKIEENERWLNRNYLHLVSNSDFHERITELKGEK